MTNAGVIGLGYVGLPTAGALANVGHSIMAADSNAEKIAVLNSGKVPIYEPGLEGLLAENRERIIYTTSTAEVVDFADVIFVSVPTPQRENGETDLSFVESVARDIASNIKDKFKIIVEKSTVPVDTGNRIERVMEKIVNRDLFEVVSNPEYLQEGLAIRDVLKPDRISIGIKSGKNYLSVRKVLENLYSKFDCPKVFSRRGSAELAKHAANGMLMQRISWINTIALLCAETEDADISEVVEHISYDPRIGPHFLKAGIGFGGSCFGKDGKSLLAVANKYGIPFKMLEDALEINYKLREMVVQDFKDNYSGSVEGKTIGILGLSFKPNTDDIREAPAIDIAQKLMDAGARVQAYDPKAMENAKRELSVYGDRFKVFSNPCVAMGGVQGILLATEWDEFRHSNLSYEVIFNDYAALNGATFFYDGRNLLDPQQMVDIGYNYVSIGRPTPTKSLKIVDASVEL